MPAALVTGAGGLVGSETVEHLVAAGFDVTAVDNDMRARFFGASASTAPQLERLRTRYPDLRVSDDDIRDRGAVERLFREAAGGLDLIVHAAAQPSHDWAAIDPHTDFSVNAVGTLNLLQATRECAPHATFVFLSTNKVYGDTPNFLPLAELETRLELPREHEYFDGITTAMSIDRSLHSLFGVSKAAADLMVQEYGRYFGIATVCFRAGCLTGPNHSGTELHGFLSYLMRCTVRGDRYTIYGYGGKQVRDNLHSRDLVGAIVAFHRAPRVAAVYNIGGGRLSNCSVLEGIARCEAIAGRSLDFAISDQARSGDHRWWISDLAEFGHHYPSWAPAFDIDDILREIYEQNVERWTAAAV
jgi:CDP-paratose 2-epimerase